MRDYNSIINYKWGSEPFTCRKAGSLAERWFFYKPNIGNLAPSPQPPFSSFCSVPYSGGYPTGYGKYNRSTSGSPSSFISKNSIKGITHFAPSGTGDIKNFYNYFLIKPSPKMEPLIYENYALDGYKIKTREYEMDAKMGSHYVAYSITSKHPVRIIPGYAGLSNHNYRPKRYASNIVQDGEYLRIYVDYESIKIFWVIKLRKGSIEKIDENEICLSGNQVDFQLAYSFDSFISAEQSFIEEENYVQTKWMDLLNKIDIEASSRVERLFYTSLYHCLKRPFIYNKEGRVFDFLTLWDMYKTQIPLIFLLYPDYGSDIVKGLTTLFSEEGFFHNSKHLNDKSYGFSEQSACIANILINTAEIYGVEYKYSDILLQRKKDILFHIRKGLPIKPNYTFNLDIADAFFSIKNANPDLGEEKIEEQIKELLKGIFDEKGVLLKTEGARYYEGSNVNYSFRVSASTDQRITFSDKEELLRALDSFFGYNGKRCKRFGSFSLPWAANKYGNKVRRFEGLNNEPDMETPYLYGLLGRHDRQNEVLNEILTNQFQIDDGGLCGNDDSGGLSSWYVWNALGLFPIIGTNRILIGCPQIEKAVINQDNPFFIEVKREREKAFYLSSVTLNGKPLEKYEITPKDIIQGGKLIICLK
ncbi:MAG: glycoside hydrolase family 92 protein [Clostridia bacterium]|jgi:hypothetical protein|nr:glycoside hydrolase family 92 protein [Clostridia bacterium]NLT18874.1 glycoside hydrolase family 92 protein [Clostridiales bacterium]OQC12851.1 MAG: Glycosyl hydrolase family 92 [Firmicutes bacterium ADurb.Bin080]